MYCITINLPPISPAVAKPCECVCVFSVSASVFGVCLDSRYFPQVNDGRKRWPTACRPYQLPIHTDFPFTGVFGCLLTCDILNIQTHIIPNNISPLPTSHSHRISLYRCLGVCSHAIFCTHMCIHTLRFTGKRQIECVSISVYVLSVSLSVCGVRWLEIVCTDPTRFAGLLIRWFRIKQVVNLFWCSPFSFF